jgi:hypothetical protein
MLEIVRQLIFLGQDIPERSEVPVGQVSTWPDGPWSPIDKMGDKLEAQQHHRFIKTHLPLDGLPFFPQVNYIVVGRDARDVAMSMWNHYAGMTDRAFEFHNNTPGQIGEPLPRPPQDIHAFWYDWIRRGWFAWEGEGYPFWGNLHHTQTWWNYRHLPNILFAAPTSTIVTPSNYPGPGGHRAVVGAGALEQLPPSGQERRRRRQSVDRCARFPTTGHCGRFIGARRPIPERVRRGKSIPNGCRFLNKEFQSPPIARGAPLSGPGLCGN